MDEDELLAWLRRRTSDRGGRWIGDDAAVLPVSGRWAVTVDSQIEGVHYPRGLDPAAAARRLLRVNLSDLAAMGALPAFAFLALATPPGFEHRRFLDAFARACDRFDLELLGGDLARHTQTTAVLTLLGSKPSGQRWVRRRDASPGEALWLGGTLGEAAAGLELQRRGAKLEGRSVRLPDDFAAPEEVLGAARRAVRRHLLPQPQLELGRWLGSRPAGAAIDISDGLAKDLHRLCAESGVGAELELDRLPVAESFELLARALDRDRRQLALSGGEDYVLLFTLSATDEPPARFGCVRVGRVLAEPGIYLQADGDRSPLPPVGWDHLERKAPP